MVNRRITWIDENAPAESFPAADTALRDPDGLLAAGGDLSPERLLAAYRLGIFPWYDEGQPLLWWSPDPRCVFLPGDFRVASRLRRTMRQSNCEIRFNTAFDAVIRACAGPRRHATGTWITQDMIAAYEILHEMGWAHSVEVWDRQQLVGGLYGIAIGRAFFGESMWSDTDNASKFALSWMALQLEHGHLDLLDCQVTSQHLLSLGAQRLPRHEFLTIPEPSLCLTPPNFRTGLKLRLPCHSRYPANSVELTNRIALAAAFLHNSRALRH